MAVTKIIGLTGGIGSGKSTIANYYMSLGIPVYIADDEAKQILYTPDAVRELEAVFGSGVMTDGKPDRAKLADVVFSDAGKLNMLNAIIHPKVAAHFKAWLDKHKDAAIVIKEAAILFESGSYKDCDKIILVTAPEELRIERVMKRDNVSRQKVLERMASQWDDKKKEALSDFVIENTDIDKAKLQAVKILNNM